MKEQEKPLSDTPRPARKVTLKIVHMTNRDLAIHAEQLFDKLFPPKCEDSGEMMEMRSLIGFLADYVETEAESRPSAPPPPDFPETENSSRAMQAKEAVKVWRAGEIELAGGCKCDCNPYCGCICHKSNSELTEGAAVQPPAPSGETSDETVTRLEALAKLDDKLFRAITNERIADRAEITRLRQIAEHVRALVDFQSMDTDAYRAKYPKLPTFAVQSAILIDLKTLLEAGGIAPPSALTIKKAQDTNFEKYRDTIAARGPDRNWMRFTEEIGELAKAIRRDNKPNMEEESADVFAWLITIAAIHGINLEAAYIAKYGSAECFRCEQVKCACPEIGAAPPSPPPTEPAA